MLRLTGEYELSTVAGEEVKAFVPYRLPPALPPLQLGGDLLRLLERAEKEANLRGASPAAQEPVDPQPPEPDPSRQ